MEHTRTTPMLTKERLKELVDSAVWRYGDGVPLEEYVETLEEMIEDLQSRADAAKEDLA